MKQVRMICLVTLMTLGWAGRGFAQEILLQATATRLTEPPVLDGKLTDECWKAAVPITGFRQYGSQTPARYQSFGYVLYDEDNLYIGVRCSEPNQANIKSTSRKHDEARADLSAIAGRGKNVWDDDGVEIMVVPMTDGVNTQHDPRVPSGEQRYFQFAVRQ